MLKRVARSRSSPNKISSASLYLGANPRAVDQRMNPHRCAVHKSHVAAADPARHHKRTMLGTSADLYSIVQNNGVQHGPCSAEILNMRVSSPTVGPTHARTARSLCECLSGWRLGPLLFVRSLRWQRQGCSGRWTAFLAVLRRHGSLLQHQPSHDYKFGVNICHQLNSISLCCGCGTLQKSCSAQS